MSKILLPAILEYDIHMRIDTKGQVQYKVSRPVETIEFVQHLSTIVHAQLEYFLLARARMLKDNLTLPPHEFIGDDNGICTVCGKPGNASTHVMRKV